MQSAWDLKIIRITGKFEKYRIYRIEVELYFKMGLSPSKKVGFIYFSESPLKVTKNYFYFILKALFFLTIFI